MNEPVREMTLDEWVNSLTHNHRARMELEDLRARLAEVEKQRDYALKHVAKVEAEHGEMEAALSEVEKRAQAVVNAATVIIRERLIGEGVHGVPEQRLIDAVKSWKKGTEPDPQQCQRCGAEYAGVKDDCSDCEVE